MANEDSPSALQPRLRLLGSTQSTILHWSAAGLVGLVAVGYAKLFHLIEAYSHGLSARHPGWSLALAPVFFLTAWGVVRILAPGARGSGIPQVMAAIHSKAEPGDSRLQSILGIRVGIVKVISSFLALAGGASIGREGPTIHLAGVVFHSIAKRWGRFLEPMTEGTWIIAAGASGLAAAFNTPLGGIVFALEELATLHLSRFRTSLISAVVVAGLVAQAIVGPYLYLGFPQIGAVTFRMLAWSAVGGILAGFLGGLFVETLHIGGRRVSSLGLRKQAAFIVFVAISITGLSVLTQAEIRGPGGDVLQAILFSPEKPSGVLLLIGRVCTLILSYITGVAGGIFAPSLAIGALLGSTLDSILNLGNANLLNLVCMTGFLAAVTRAPFTALVVVLEMTDRHSIIFPLMLGSVIASAIAGLFAEHSFYHRQSRTFLTDLQRGAI